MLFRSTVLAFFEERRGRAYGFRWKDWADFKSCAPSQSPAATDQTLGTGDGTDTTFQLIKTYGASYLPWPRTIAKPVSGTLRVAVNGGAQTEGVDFSVDSTTGIVTFTAAPPNGQSVTAGFEFDVPVRFDTDSLEIEMAAGLHGGIPNVPVVELRS